MEPVRHNLDGWDIKLSQHPYNNAIWSFSKNLHKMLALKTFTFIIILINNHSPPSALINNSCANDQRVWINLCRLWDYPVHPITNEGNNNNNNSNSPWKNLPQTKNNNNSNSSRDIQSVKEEVNWKDVFKNGYSKYCQVLIVIIIMNPISIYFHQLLIMD